MPRRWTRRKGARAVAQEDRADEDRAGPGELARAAGDEQAVLQDSMQPSASSVPSTVPAPPRIEARRGPTGDRRELPPAAASAALAGVRGVGARRRAPRREPGAYTRTPEGPTAHPRARRAAGLGLAPPESRAVERGPEARARAGDEQRLRRRRRGDALARREEARGEAAVDRVASVHPRRGRGRARGSRGVARNGGTRAWGALR